MKGCQQPSITLYDKIILGWEKGESWQSLSHSLSLQPAEKGMNLVELSQDFLITWNYFYTAVEKEVTLMKGRSFGEQIIMFLL